MTEQILKASPKPDGSATLLKSPMLHSTISDSDYQFLMYEAVKDTYWLKPQEIVALIHREQVVDMAGRDGELRHILLIPLFEYIEATKHIFELLFATADTIPDKLETLKVTA